MRQPWIITAIVSVVLALVVGITIWDGVAQHRGEHYTPPPFVSGIITLTISSIIYHRFKKEQSK